MERLKKYFDTALESVDGIKKLRELILTLAMQGKLVEQDPKDQPASELLKEIKAEKERLIKEGKIKKQKELPPIKTEVVPYQVPEAWEWVRFYEITINRDGERIPVSKEDRKKMYGEYDYYGASGVIDKVDNYLFEKDLLLIGEDGANLLSRSTPIAFIAKGKYWVNNHAHVIDSTIPELLLFLVHYFASIKLDKYVTGTAQPKMNQEKMNSILVVLPPLAEQKRIVAKIDELMTLCDKLEAQRNERNEKRLKVHKAAINRLLNASKKEDFNSSWQFITRHFDPLYSVKENVAELKKAILTLAMQGKLVKQDPNDQSASELLREIQAEKERLIKEGKIRKPKKALAIEDDEIPHELPEGWTWIRKNDLFSLKKGKVPKDLSEEKKQFPYLDIEALDRGNIRRYTNDIKCPHSTDKDILVVCDGSRSGLLLKGKNGAIGSTIAIIETFDQIKPYVELVFKQSYERLNSTMKGAAIPHLDTKNMLLEVIGLPPLKEQKRIVVKIEEVIGLCDNLENQIEQATEKQTALFDAVLAKVS